MEKRKRIESLKKLRDQAQAELEKEWQEKEK